MMYRKITHGITSEIKISSNKWPSDKVSSNKVFTTTKIDKWLRSEIYKQVLYITKK